MIIYVIKLQNKIDIHVICILNDISVLHLSIHLYEVTILYRSFPFKENQHIFPAPYSCLVRQWG